jgi:hypothetical protein
VDTKYYSVNIPAGYYDLTDINNAFYRTLSKNFHYFVNTSNKTKVFTMYFAYNTVYKKVELHTSKINDQIFNTSNFSRPLDPSADPATDRTPIYIKTWNTPNVANSVVPVIVVLNNAFQNAIGFNAGSYPDTPIPTNMAVGPLQNLINLDNIYLSAFTPGIQPNYVVVVYKPSNPQFASQGGVSASSQIARTKYNAITNNTAIYSKAFGNSVANALAYGVSDTGYTIKNKIGFPLRKTPKFSKYSDAVICKTCNTWDTQNSTQAN